MNFVEDAIQCTTLNLSIFWKDVLCGNTGYVEHSGGGQGITLNNKPTKRI